MSCKPKCAYTATIDHLTGRRLMISEGGSKYPKGTPHGMCDECVAEQLEDAKLGVLFNNDKNLIERYKKVMR